MKNIYKVLLSCFMAVTLASCGNSDASDESANTSSMSTEDTSTDTSEDTSVETSDTTIDESSSSSDAEDTEYTNVPNWGETSFKISSSDDLIDVSIDKVFITGFEYSIKYELVELPNVNGSEIVESSNPKVFTLDKVANSSYKLTCLHAGRAFLRITDSNGIRRFCRLITVEDAIPQDEMEEYLVYEADYWYTVYGWGDTYTLTFFENGEFSLSGTITNSAFEPINGTYAFQQVSADGKEYQYIFTDSESANQSFYGFNVSIVGDCLYLLDSVGLAALLYPQK